MKTIKIFATAFLLFLAASVNLVSAQEINTTDSIYRLEASVVNNVMNLSFYTTYDMANLTIISMSTYDGSTSDWGSSSYWDGFGAEYYKGAFDSPNFGEITIDSVSEGVHKIIINNIVLSDFYKNKTCKIRLFVEGYSYAPLFEVLPAVGIRGYTNSLTTFFNKTASSLNETINNKSYTYKYYLLSGIEVRESPKSVPFVRRVYNGSKLISIEKILINK